jgi:hypothetical protein
LQSDVTPLGSYVGFDSITNQIERKLLKRGFQFNIICVGNIAWQAFELTCVQDRQDWENQH